MRTYYEIQYGEDEIGWWYTITLTHAGNEWTSKRVRPDTTDEDSTKAIATRTARILANNHPDHVEEGQI